MPKNNKKVKPSALQRCLTKVRAKLGRDLVEKVWKDVQDERVNLWGLVKHDNFKYHTFLVALYKDLYNKGYHVLARKFEEFLPVSNKTHLHNQKEWRVVFGKWGRSQITPGGAGIWNRLAKKWQLGELVKDVNLAIDSSDFRKEGKRAVSRKDASWSFKCNSPGRRFMSLVDARTEIRGLFGGYSPKTYDGQWMESSRELLERVYPNAVIVGDQHFESAKKIGWETIKIHAPSAEPTQGKQTKDGIPSAPINPDKRKYNNQVRHARHRVESPFGIMKTRFECLSVPWREEDNQLSHLVFFATGVHNYKIRQRFA